MNKKLKELLRKQNIRFKEWADEVARRSRRL